MSESRIYQVKVNFGREDLVVDGNEIKISVDSKPEKNKANLEIIKRLAKHFNVDQKSVKILRGAASRKKIIEIMK
ncbi:MAG: DUF167 domain-containing protein [Candidatus Aenigmarchaeota archaeon]|nr:DUF167 domain-containing protein [Candidatus Aenigmarchaeota archaeon]